MGMDVDYVFANEAIKELEDLVSDQEHGERKEITDEIIDFVEALKLKYKPK